jgi:hypothetical protein
VVDAGVDRGIVVAATANDVTAVERAIADGASVETVTSSGVTVLGEAVRAGASKTVVALLDRGADPLRKYDVDGRTALHDAVRCGNSEIVRALLSRGVPVDTHNALGQTPLAAGLAERASKIDVSLVDELARRGADLRATERRPSEYSPDILLLHLAAGHAEVAITTYLLDHAKHSSKERDAALESAMHDCGPDEVAARVGTCKVLLARGAHAREHAIERVRKNETFSTLLGLPSPRPPQPYRGGRWMLGQRATITNEWVAIRTSLMLRCALIVGAFAGFFVCLSHITGESFILGIVLFLVALLMAMATPWTAPRLVEVTANGLRIDDREIATADIHALSARTTQGAGTGLVSTGNYAPGMISWRLEIQLRDGTREYIGLGRHSDNFLYSQEGFDATVTAMNDLLAGASNKEKIA